MNRTFLWLSLGLLAFLNMAAVNKAQDPIRDTQTNPIGLNEKTDELKDGQKEAPKPSMKLYPDQGFLAQSNLSSKNTDEGTAALKDDKSAASDTSMDAADEDANEDKWEAEPSDDKWEDESYNQDDEDSKEDTYQEDEDFADADAKMEDAKDLDSDKDLQADDMGGSESDSINASDKD